MQSCRACNWCLICVCDWPTCLQVCLYVLDTPTRFETPKEVAAQ